MVVVRGRSLGALINMAVAIRSSKHPDAPEEKHLELASQFVELLSGGSDRVMDEFNRIVNFITASPLDYEIESGVRFFALVLGRMVASPNEAVSGLGHDVLKGVAARTRCVPKATRWRSCQLLSCFLEQLPSDAELDDDIADELQQAFLGRLADKENGIRAEAAKGVHRLQGGGDESARDAVTEALLDAATTDGSAKVRAAALNALPTNDDTLAVILERTSDTGEVVQAMALNVLGQKVRSGQLSGEALVHTASKALTDASEFVRTVAERMLSCWLQEWAQGDPVTLVGLLDPINSEVKCEQVVTHLLASKTISLEALCSSCAVGDSVWQGRSLDSNWVFLLRVACIWLHAESNRAPDPKDISEQTEKQAIVETLDRVRPAVAHLVESVRHHVATGEWFQARQFVATLAGACDLNDAFHRQQVAALLAEVATLDGGQGWLEASLSLCSVVWVDPKDFVENALDVLQGVPLGNEISLHECKLVAEVFRWMHARVAVPARHQPFVAKLLTTLTTLVQFADGMNPELVATSLEALSLYCLVFGMDQGVAEAVHSSWQHSCPQIRKAGLKGLIDMGMWFGIKTVIQSVGSDAGLVDAILSHTIVHNAHDAGRVEGRDGEWDEAFSAIEVTATQGVCRLVYFNNKWKDKGMDKATALGCLKRLIVVMCHPRTNSTPEVDQMLEVFFEKFATASTANQHDLQTVLLPAVYECSTLPGRSHSPACQALNLVLDLLFAPVDAPRGEPKRVTSGHTHLGCLLLWELVHHSENSKVNLYATTLWKAISNLDFGDAPDKEIRVLASLVEYWAGEGGLNRHRVEMLRDKLGDAIVGSLSDDKLEDALAMLQAYFDQLQDGCELPEFDVDDFMRCGDLHESEGGGSGNGDGEIEA